MFLVVRKNVELRQEEILDATVARIESEGLQSLRIADVARDLGVSPALLIYHFQTKDVLIAAAFRYAAVADLDRALALADGSGSPLERLWDCLRWYAPTAGAYGWRLWIEGYAGAVRNKALADVVDELEAEWSDLLLRLVKEAMKADEVDVKNAKTALTRITSMVDGMSMGLVRGSMSIRRLNDWMREHVARELGIDEKKLSTSRRGR